MKAFIRWYMIIAAAVLWSGCAKLQDDLPQPVNPGVQVHPPSWMDTASANFHGTALKTGSSNVQSCLVCHGQDYNGGTSNVSCITCHRAAGANIHGRGWEDPASPRFHGKVIAAANWDMRPCQPCHGTRYTGGSTPVSCTTCHNQPGGPENCATCHGSANPAPPRDLRGNTARSARGVGAHQVHVVGTSLSAPMFCHQCHTVPGATYDPTHIDQTPNAEVVMIELARTKTNEPSTTTYSPTLPLFETEPGIRCQYALVCIHLLPRQFQEWQPEPRAYVDGYDGSGHGMRHVPRGCDQADPGRKGSPKNFGAGRNPSELVGVLELSRRCGGCEREDH